VSDVSPDDSIVNEHKMVSKSILYIILESSAVQESKEILKSSGNLIIIAKGVFLSQSTLRKQQVISQDFPLISFQKSREIPSARELDEEGMNRRVYSIVSYRFKEPTTGQKKRVERLVRKSLAIRIRPRILLFPLLKSKDRRRILDIDETVMFIDSKKVSEELRNLGAKVNRWTKLRVVDNPAKLHASIICAFSRDAKSIEEIAKELGKKAKNPEIDIRKVRKEYSSLFRRYQEFKIKWSHSTIWQYDTSKLISRVYNQILSTRRSIESER
jgi:hypothetical protein